jgi:hypothetical protein
VEGYRRPFTPQEAREGLFASRNARGDCEVTRTRGGARDTREQAKDVPNENSSRMKVEPVIRESSDTSP